MLKLFVCATSVVLLAGTAIFIANKYRYLLDDKMFTYESESTSEKS
jgi:hypothetical protein